MSKEIELDEETRNLLMQGMSAVAAQASMGVDVGEMADVRKQEYEDLARDMEAKNKAAQLKRAMMVAGGSPQYQQSEVQQKPVKRKRKGMVKQETSTPARKAPLQPASAIPEQAQALPPGLTAEDMALIEAVKASRARSRDQYLETSDSVHPGARGELPPAPRREVPDTVHEAVHETVERAVGASRQAYAQVPPAPEFVQPAVKPLERSVRPSVQEILAMYGYGDVQLPSAAPESPAPEARAAQPMTQASAEQVQPVQNALDFQAKQEQPKPFVLPGATRRFDPGVPDKDFEAFTEITGWPSRGLLYPEPVYGQALKSIDAYMLSCSDSSDLYTALTAIFGRRLRGISPEDILTADEQYLLYWLRASSVDESENGLPKPAFACPHCHKRYSDPEALQLTAPLTFMNLDFVNENSPEEVAAMHREEGFVRYGLRDGRECDIYLRRRKHDRIYEEYVSGWEKANKELFPEFRQKMLDIAVLVEIEDCETISDKMRYIEELPLADRKDLMGKIVTSQMVVTTNVSLECPACGGTVTMPYPFHRELYVASL